MIWRILREIWWFLQSPLIVDVRCMVCPFCRGRHVDRGIWRRRPHKRHLCERCGRVFGYFEYEYTRGLPDPDPKSTLHCDGES